MKRREFMSLVGGAAALWPLAASAQQPDRMRRIGVLISIGEGDLETKLRTTAFEQELQKLGWTSGHNVRIEYRHAGGDVNRIRGYAAELVAMAPDVILAQNNQAVSFVQRETGTIPIVFVQVADPVGLGYVATLAKPGGNITGFTSFEFSTSGKWLELLKDIAPKLRRVTVILDRQSASNPGYLGAIQAVAPSFGVALMVAGVRDATEIERAIEASSHDVNGGLIFLPNIIATVHRERIAAQVIRHRVPAVYPARYFPTSGGLMSYGIDVVDLFRRAASYVDKILKGAKPSDLPVQQPTKYELVINLKTAKALGLTIPPTLLALADEVIE